MLVSIAAAFLGGGLVSGLAQVITARSTAKKSQFETAMALIQELQDQRQATLKEMAELEAKYEKKCNDYETIITRLEAEIVHLRAVMSRCGIDPDQEVPTPAPRARRLL